ncbi:MAG: adenylate/guanylate cyclase domain-containing protein [Cyanobium sp.]
MLGRLSGRPISRPTRLLVLSGVILAATGWLAGWPPPIWRGWERTVEDELVRLRGGRQSPARVVLVPIDDASLQQGAWFAEEPNPPAWAQGISTLPWPRARYAELIEKLRGAGAASVAINVVFEGPSSRGAKDDGALAAALGRHRGHVALAAEYTEPQDEQTGAGLSLVKPDVFTAALGLTNVLPPGGGEPTRHPEFFGQVVLPAQQLLPFPALSTTALAQAGLAHGQKDSLRELNFYGPEPRFTRIPAWEVLDPARWASHAKRGALQGAVVLVGPVVSQGGMGSPTPFGPMSGLELLATATANSLVGDGLAPWPAVPLARGLLAMAPVLLVSLMFLRNTSKLKWRMAVLGGVLVLQLLAGYGAMRWGNRWLPLLAPLTALVLIAGVYGVDAYLVEGKERRRLRRTFERYVAPSVVSEILSSPEDADAILRGRLLPVTVLFCDLQGFTTLTKKRADAGQTQALVEQLNEYLGEMVEVITAHGGTVDKFIGDCVVAVFGSPVSRGVHEEAVAAVTCAQAMGAALAQLNQGWQGNGVEPLGNGIGLASGEVVVGQIGSPRRMEFTVIGDKVNLAARLEALTRKLEVNVLLDGSTMELAGPTLAFRHLGLQPIRGAGDIDVYTLA